jgi:hypothetical protein
MLKSTKKEYSRLQNMRTRAANASKAKFLKAELE